MADAFGLQLGFAELTGPASFAGLSLNSSTRKIAWLMQSPVAFTCSRVVFRYGSRTGTPPTYRASLQSPSTTDGSPDGTILGGGSPASATFTPPADATWDATTREITLTNSIALTAGQWVQIVVDYSSGTVDASNFSSFTLGAAALRYGERQTIPAAWENTGSWVARQSELPTAAIGDGTNFYGSPIQSVSQSSTNTAGHRVALRLLLASGYGDTFKIRGLRVCGRQGMASGTIKIGVWEGATEKQADSYDSDYKGSSGADGDIFEYYFSAPVALNFGTAYYLGLENVSGTATLFANRLVVGTAAHRSAFQGGADFYLSTYNGSSWSDDTTQRPMIEPIFGDLTEPAAGVTVMPIRRGLNARL